MTTRNLVLRRSGSSIQAGILALILAVLAAGAEADGNSNTTVVDGVEYYLQTDKYAYPVGGTVAILHRATNQREEAVTFEGSWWFDVKDDGERMLWGHPKYVVTSAGSVLFTLQPEEFLEYPVDWDMMDWGEGPLDSGDDVHAVPGVYSVYGELDGQGTSVTIQIVPEPATFWLFGTGALMLIRRKPRSPANEPGRPTDVTGRSAPGKPRLKKEQDNE